MWWFVDDFFGDTDVQGMSASELGAYVCLILAAWKAGLEDNHQRLARISRLGRRWSASSALLLSKFVKCDDGRWHHPKHLKMKQDREEYTAKQAEHGRNGARGRWGTPSQNYRVPHEKPIENDGVGMASLALTHSLDTDRSLRSEPTRGSFTTGTEGPVASDPTRGQYVPPPTPVSIPRRPAPESRGTIERRRLAQAASPGGCPPELLGSIPEPIYEPVLDEPAAEES